MNDQYQMECVYAGPPTMDESDQISRFSLLMENGRSIALTKLFYSIGRNNSCDLVIDKPSVSRNHAHLHYRSGQWYLCDDGSLNGTYINNAPLPRGMQYPLNNGDRISLGRKFSFVFCDEPDGSWQNTRYPFTYAESMGKNSGYY